MIDWCVPNSEGEVEGDDDKGEDDGDEVDDDGGELNGDVFDFLRCFGATLRIMFLLLEGGGFITMMIVEKKIGWLKSFC